MTFKDPEIADLKKGDKPTISISYTNVGTVEITQNWTIKVTDIDHTVKEATISGTLGPGETRYYNITNYKLRKGDRTFTVYLDLNGVIAEMNEDENNQLETVVHVDEEGWGIDWWWGLIALAVVLVGYVVYMKYTRSEWGYEPIQRWWEKRNS